MRWSSLSFGTLTHSLKEQLLMKPNRLLVVALFLLGSVNGAVAAGPEDSVVRVFGSLRLPNPTRPWAKQNPVQVMGTGVVIDGKTVLTNAHVVVYASEVFVQDRRGGDRVPAKVTSMGPGIDLATLVPEDRSFCAKRPGIARAAKHAAAGDSVVLMGFSTNSPGLTVSRGVVSRIDHAPYADLTEGILIRVDTQPMPGNSGGPALADGKMVGLVFRRAQNAGFVIPNEEIDAYLADVKDGRYDGKLRVSDRFQTLVNEALRKKLGLARSDRGVLVREPRKSDSSYPLREGDVVTHIGTAEVDNEGLADYQDNLRLPFTALVPRLAERGNVPVRLIRGGKRLEASIVATREGDRLIRPYQGRYPSYFVHGPLVFSPAIEEALPTYAENNPFAMLGSPLSTRDTDRVAFPGEELVVVTAPLLAHPLTRGYSDPFGLVVKDVDGVSVRNLRHLVELLRDGRGEYLTIRFFGEMSETLVFIRRAIEDSTPDLMRDNGIPKRGTDDLMAVWGARAPAR
jgi:S1-C subfamily serine protease